MCQANLALLVQLLCCNVDSGKDARELAPILTYLSGRSVGYPTAVVVRMQDRSILFPS